jgi:hypothetical protein
MAQWPMTVVMQRRPLRDTRRGARWAAVAVLPAGWELASAAAGSAGPCQMVSGLMLELHSDETEGYRANWAAPQPRVYVQWRPEGDRAVPLAVSVSSAEGTRMLDAGPAADVVPMPAPLHRWLGECLRLQAAPGTPRRRRR